MSGPKASSHGPSKEPFPDGLAVCPEVEMLSAYVDGTLDLATRSQVEQHLSQCDDCYYVVRETGLALPSLQSLTKVRTASGWLLAVAATLLVGLGLTVAWIQTWRETNPVEQLAQEVGRRRFFEARLSGGFQYGPLVGAPRSGTSSRSASWRLVGLAGELNEKAVSNPTEENLRALALVQLILGESDDSIQMLENMVREYPRNATFRNDLAAAYLTRAESQDRADDWPKALESAEIALELEPGLREALYNKALALESINLRHEATEAWEAFVAEFPDDDWVPLIMERLERLQIIGRDASPTPTTMEEVRLSIEEQLLGLWATSVENGDRMSADGVLARARRLAQEYRAATNDELLAAAIDRIAQSDWTHDLVVGHRLYQQGIDASREESWVAASKAFRQSQARLRAGGTPFSHWARVQTAICEYYLGNHEQSLEILESVLDDAPQEFFALRARALWIRGLVQFVRGMPFEAHISHRESLRIFNSLKEEEHASMVASLAGNDLAALGRTPEAWTLWLDALSSGDLPLSARRTYLLYWGIARASKDKMPRAALHLTREMTTRIRRVAKPSDVGVLASALIDLVRTGIDADPTAPLSLLAEAESLASIASPDMRVVLQADVDLARGYVLGRIDPERAVVSFSSAHSYFAAVNEKFELISLLLGRAEALHRIGRTDEALRDHQSGLEELRRAASRLPDTHSRLRLAAESERLSSQLVGSLVRVGSHERALLALEQIRALMHGGRQGEARMRNLGTLSRIQSALPDGLLVVEFVVLDEDIAVWAISSEFHRFRLLEGATASIRDLTPSPVGMALHGHEFRFAYEAYETIFGWLGEELSGVDELVIVPDGPLYAIPFGWVLHKGNRRVRYPTVSVSPSLFHVVRSGRPNLNLAPTALVVRGETGAALERLGLPPLPGVADEAAGVASGYSGNIRFVEDRVALAEALGQSDVIHFAGHALQNDASPELEAFVLRGNDELVLFYARDVERVRLRRGSIVVLASCRTGADGSGGRTVAPGFVQAFLDSGASTVIASLWDIDDRASARFMAKLHHRIASGVPAEQALKMVMSSATEDGPIADALAVYVADLSPPGGP